MVFTEEERRIRQNKANLDFRMKNPDYWKQWKLNHPGYANKNVNEWNKAHRERKCERSKKYRRENSEIIEAQNFASNHKIPITALCETCPEDEVNVATQRHHPDYDYPEITVSCCAKCHWYLNRPISIQEGPRFVK